MSKGKVLEGWSILKVKDIFERVRNPVEVIKDEKYTQIGIRSHGKGIFYKEEVTGEKLGSKSVFWVEPDCFVVNIVFAWEMAVARTTNKDRGYIASHRFPMYRPKKGVLDLDFITYLFKSPRGKYLLNLASPGGAGRNKTLGQKEFDELEILLPTNIAEQKKIALILSTCDKSIVLKEKLIEKKIEQKKCLMQKLLTGELRLPDFKSEWEEIMLCDLGEFKTSSVDKKINPNEEEILLVNYMDVYRNNVIDNNLEFMKVTATEKQIDTFEVLYGDVLFTPSSETPEDIGHSAVVKLNASKILYSYHLVRLRFQKEMDVNFKAYAFNSPKLLNQFAKKATGVTRCTLSLKDFKDAVITIPTEIEEQKAIGMLLSNWDKEINLLEQELVMLKKQKQGLMQQLLTGKIRVKV